MKNKLVNCHNSEERFLLNWKWSFFQLFFPPIKLHVSPNNCFLFQNILFFKLKQLIELTYIHEMSALNWPNCITAWETKQNSFYSRNSIQPEKENPDATSISLFLKL